MLLPLVVVACSRVATHTPRPVSWRSTTPSVCPCAERVQIGRNNINVAVLWHIYFPFVVSRTNISCIYSDDCFFLRAITTPIACILHNTHASKPEDLDLLLKKTKIYTLFDHFCNSRGSYHRGNKYMGCAYGKGHFLWQWWVFLREG